MNENQPGRAANVITPAPKNGAGMREVAGGLGKIIT